jgi:diacylglycerol kinase (ATP)
MKALIIDNASHKKSKKLIKILKKYLSIELLTTKDPEGISSVVDYALNNGFKLIISSGGDGTINHLINEMMTRKEDVRKNIFLSVLPCGKANDLARGLGIPKNLDKAIKQILSGRKINPDLIKVNKKYFITGGGFGLPAEVIWEKERSFICRNLGDKAYLYAVLKLIIFGYKEVKNLNFSKINYENIMLFSVMNQEFIGKRFYLTPSANNRDGFLDFCIIKKGKNFIIEFLRLLKVLKKNHLKCDWANFYKRKKLKVSFSKKEYFMADGEILDFSDKFYFSVISNQLTFLH